MIFSPTEIKKWQKSTNKNETVNFGLLCSKFFYKLLELFEFVSQIIGFFLENIVK